MKKCLIGALLIACTGLSYANTQQENAELALVVNQLQGVYPLIAQAEREAPHNSREQFHYDWLRQDLAVVIAGINQKLHPEPIEPRAIHPIKGDYLTLRSRRL